MNELPTTCEECEERFSDGIHKFVRMRLKSFHHVNELHALIRALEAERDGLRGLLAEAVLELTAWNETYANGKALLTKDLIRRAERALGGGT